MARKIGFRDSQQPPEGDAWAGILDRDERIIWQGRPDGAIVFRAPQLVGLIFGAAFAGFALIWMIVAAQAGGYFWMFGLLHFAVGIAVGIGGLFLDRLRRRRSVYSLSNKRAFIASDMPLMGRRLKSFPITAETVLETDGNDPATIYFASETRRHHTRRGSRTSTMPIGFVRIDDGANVYALLRKIQRGAV